MTTKRNGLIVAAVVAAGVATQIGNEKALASRCALIDSGSIATYRTFESNCPPDPAGKPNLKWLPAPIGTPPTFDPATQVRSDKSVTIGASEVTESWSVRDKTAQELADEVAAEQTATMDRINRAVLKVLCRLENHDRVSDGKAALTPAQCRAAFKGLL